MNRARSPTDQPARALNEWFASVLCTCDMVFQLPETTAHREAVIHSMLTSNAKVIIASEIDDKGKLYPAVAKALAAACRKLGVETNVGHWKAALQNVLGASAEFGKHNDTLGLALGSPAAVFKSLFDEALINSGVTDRPTILVEENRKTALGLAINWGMRFLLAYAAELPTRGRRAPASQDVWWIRSLIEPLRAS
jgi:hypothetical protein